MLSVVKKHLDLAIWVLIKSLSKEMAIRIEAKEISHADLVTNIS